MGIGTHTKPVRGETDTWLTPPEILAALGPFDLDPCCPHQMPWRTANVMVNPDGDGLSYRWRGRVWMNQPYGQEAEAWFDRLSVHGNGIALIFARTETDMFFRFVWERAGAILFLRGRLHFHHIDGSRAKGNAGGPSCLIAYGKNNVESLKSSGLDGRLVLLHPTESLQCGKQPLAQSCSPESPA